MAEDLVLWEFPDLSNSRVPALFGCSGSGSPEIIGLYAASQVDAEQDSVLPNLSRNPVLGPLQPGVTHGLWFGNRSVNKVVEPALLLDQRTVASRVSASVSLTDGTKWTIVQKVDPNAAVDTRLWYAGGRVLVLRSSDLLEFWDGSTATVSASTVQALIGRTTGTPFWTRTQADGSTATVDVSSDGITWVNAITRTISPITLTSLDIGSSNTTQPFHGWVYSLQVRDGGPTDPLVADWTPDLHPAGSRADTDTATDPAGTVWTITRPSTADSNDPTRVAHNGTNKVWFPATPGDGLESSGTLSDLTSGDLVVTVRHAQDWQGGATTHAVVGTFGYTTDDRGFSIYRDSSGVPVLSVSSDGTSGNQTAATFSTVNMNDHPWWKFTAPTVSGAWTIHYSDSSNDWLAPDDPSWVLAESQVQTNRTLHGGSTKVQWGSRGANGSPENGYGGSLICGGVWLDGTLASRMSAADASDGAATSWTDSVTGETITVYRSTTGATTTVVTEDVTVTNGYTFYECLWDPALTVQAGESLTVALAFRSWSDQSWAHLVGISDVASGAIHGWDFQQFNTGGNRHYMQFGDGTEMSIGNAADDVPVGDKGVIEATIISGDQEAWGNGVSKETKTVTFGAVDPPSTLAMRLGSKAFNASGKPAELFALAILKDTARTTDAESTSHYQELSA